MNDFLQTVDWSRAQFALTAAYHWLFVPLTLGLGVMCAIMETLYVRTGSDFWKRTVRFWMRLFGINFAVGVATGLILEFEFGTNWSNYSHFVGDIFGAPLAVEGIMAFFLESTFVAVMFFGWDKVSKRFHLAATWLTAIGANLSALWILVANAWMQHPVGCTFNVHTMRNEMTSFSEVLFSPAAMTKFFHTVTSAFVLAAVFVAGVSAWYLLRSRERRMARSSMTIAAVFGLVSSVAAAFTGDLSGGVMARTQPMKLAAVEALYDGSEGAPLVVAGIFKPESERDGGEAFRFKIEIPKMLSVMSFHDADAYVAGINDLLQGNPGRDMLSVEQKMERGRVVIEQLARLREAKKCYDADTVSQVEALFDPSTPEGAEFLREYFAYFGYGYLRAPEQAVPPVPLLFWSFRVMVGAGCLFLLLFALLCWQAYRNRLYVRNSRWLFHACIWSIPLAYISSQAGWIVAEVGRQPWVIQDLMPVDAAISQLPSASVKTTFFIFLLLFTALFIAEIRIMLRQIAIGPESPGELRRNTKAAKKQKR